MKEKSGIRVAILGWGVDTEDVVPFLLENGAKLTVFDKKEEIEGKWRGDGRIGWVLGREDFGDLSKFEVIVRSPGVYRYRKEIVEAEKKGVRVSSKTKIFFDYCPAKIIGVTGTKGKGTTSTLIYEMLKAGGEKVFLAGNIGKGMFDFWGELDGESWVVLELSSFQLIDLHKSPHIGVVLMTTSDHMDWHKDVGEYLEAKANILRYQLEEDFAVVNKDYPNSVKLAGGKGKKFWVSRDELGFIKPEEIRLRGVHNRENIAAASTVARIVGVEEETIKKVVREFRGLEHRLEEVEEVEGVKYYDDSISTVPETTIAALRAFEEGTVLIAGGSEKGSDFTRLGEEIAKRNNIRGVVVVGMMAQRIKEAILKAEGKVRIEEGCKSMGEIVRVATSMANKGDVVLLSPGAASFDMFKSYKDRGDQFKVEVRGLGK